MTEPYSLAPVREGEILAGKYCVERVLGVGGMGVVVAARHVHLGQQLALKFLLPDACKNADAVGRFLREARACVRMQGEHVTRVSDVGTLENGAPYMVMEFLQGVDLEEVIAQRGPLPVPDAVGYVLQACEAIAEAHALGIIHRDLKPRNLFLTHRPDGSALIKVLDFGISKMLDPLQMEANLTATSMMLGSPLYMSPEQVRNAKGVDTRTDIWSLGVILFQLLTGRGPFDASTPSGLLAAIVADPPASLRTFRPDASPELELVLLRCFEKTLARRTASVGQLARDLAPFANAGDQISVERVLRLDRHTSQAAGRRPDGSTSVLPASVEPGRGGQVHGTGTVNAWSESGTGGSNRRWRVQAGGIGLLAVAAVLGFVAIRTWSAESSDVPTSASSAAAAAVAATASAKEATILGAPSPGDAEPAQAFSGGPAATAPIGTTTTTESNPLAQGAASVLTSPSSPPAARPRPTQAPRPNPPSGPPPRRRDRARELFNDIN